MIKTYSYRVKNLNGLLNKQSRAVNFVWNFCNESQKSAIRLGKKWLSGYDLNSLTAETNKDLGLLASTIQRVGQQYAKSRQQFKKPFLQWRTRRSLGWIPLKEEGLKIKGEGFRFGKHDVKVFMSRPIPKEAKILCGSSFSQDTKGNWFLNVVVELPDVPLRPIKSAIGIDLGLKDFATLSTGEKITNPKHLSKLATKLAKAQRARKKKQVVNIHSKIRNSRTDFRHKLSTKLVKQFDFIAVGNVSSSKLAKTKMAKSVLDASWSSFRNMLCYKAIGHGATFSEVNESYSTQACSSCGSLSPESPKGIADLGIRTWTCSECLVTHDRDINAAKNILFASGHRGLAEGTSAVAEEMSPRSKKRKNLYN